MHADGLAPTEQGLSGSKTGGFSLFEGVSVAVVLLLWALFGMAAWVSPGTLNEVWTWVNDLPMAARVVVWVIGLPWMAGLAIWQGGWPDLVRLALIAGLAVASVWTFWPKKAR